MRLSKRIDGFQASPIRRLVPYANEAKKRGVHIFHLNIGQPDIKTPPQVIEAVRSYDKEIIAYGQSEGDLALREALPSYYKNYNVDLTYEDILITTGGSEAIQFVFMTLADPGDEIIVVEPYYTNVDSFAKSANVKLKAVTSTIEDNFVLPTIDEFEKQITDRTRAIMLCSPNNPTGHIYTDEEYQQILTLIKKYNLFLIVDEVYKEFCYDGKEFISILTYTDFKDHVVVVDSFSKRYSMCGSRIGTLISRNHDILNGAMKLAQARLCPPDIEQHAALAAVTKTDKAYLGSVKKEYEKRRNFIVKELSKVDGIVCSVPKGAFYLVAKLPVKDAEDFCIYLLKDFNLNNQTVMLAPAEGFYVSDNLGKDEVRIAYVLKEEDLKSAVDCLKAALEAYPNRV
jgi:aspartate aminotransferase